MTLKQLGVSNVVLGQALQKTRKMAKLTQEELADRLKCEDPSYLSKLENGKKNISMDWVFQYGVGTGLGMDIILTQALLIANTKMEQKTTGIPLFELLSERGKLKITSDVLTMIEYENADLSEEQFEERVRAYREQVIAADAQNRKDSQRIF